METTIASSNGEYSSANPFSLLGVTILCLLLHWLVILRDIFSKLPNLFLKSRAGNNNPCPTPRAPTSLTYTPHHVNEDDNKLFREEVELVMDKLGLFGDSKGDEELRERLGSDDMKGMFDEFELRAEEVEEAFQVFDENCDGFIDANELGTILCKLGFEGVSELECEKMIATYDDNGDGCVDLSEFAKLLGVCC